MSEAAVRSLHVLEIEPFGRGGLTHYVWNLSRALAGRGHRVDLVTARDYEFSGRKLPPGVRVHQPIGRRQPAMQLARQFEALLDARSVGRLARDLRPDVTHFHGTNSSSLAYLSPLARLGVPLVSTAHNVTPHERVRFQEVLYRRIHKLPDLVIAHAQADRTRLEDEFGVTRERCVVVPHGDYGFFADPARPPDRAALRARLGLAEDAPVALFFGFMREYKGLDRLLDAWPRVVAAVPRARLVIAGDPVRLGPARCEELRRRAERLGAVHRFEYIPFEEVADYFAVADLLVLPYRRISQSGVLYLGLALGVPVVATAISAWQEMLEDGDSALLVEPDSPAALADATIRALRDPALRARLAAGGRRVASEHSWPAVAEKTERAFLQLLTPGSS